MEAIQDEIVKWHKETFPRATIQAILDKLDEELHEALDEIKGGDLKKLFEELADVVIVTCALAGALGINFEDVIIWKLEVNKNRTWVKELPNGDRVRER